MRQSITLLLLFFTAISFAQKEFHVFPIDSKSIKGSPQGDGSLNNPWDLQTALSQPFQRVNGGDIIWLHEGVYSGRYKSTLKSVNEKFITVSGYKNDLVVLNGNIDSNLKSVLEVSGEQVIFKNFEVTFLGEYSRNEKDINFNKCDGINHLSGVSKFQSIIIHNNPGLGFGSWKSTGGSVIEDCLIFYNGYISENRGEGEGMYVQNKSDDTRIIRNNIIFGNYYKGVEVWSASSGHDYEFVKNVNLSNNIFFNNGLPSGTLRDNIIIATNDTKGTNIASNISVENNVLYQNIDFKDSNNYGTGVSLAIGFKARALVEEISVVDNIILGRNNGLNLMHIKSLEFKNNTVYSGYINIHKSSIPALEKGNFILDNNSYYTRKRGSHRVIEDKTFNYSDWQKIFNVDKNSEWKHLKDFEINPVLKIQKLSSRPNEYNVALLEKNGNNVTVDFINYNIKEGSTFKIYDIENRNVVLKSGKLSGDKKITFPMTSSAYEKPLHNTIATKSAGNFCVFRVEFEAPKEKRGLLNRIFGWLF